MRMRCCKRKERFMPFGASTAKDVIVLWLLMKGSKVFCIMTVSPRSLWKARKTSTDNVRRPVMLRLVGRTKCRLSRGTMSFRVVKFRPKACQPWKKKEGVVCETAIWSVDGISIFRHVKDVKFFMIFKTIC